MADTFNPVLSGLTSALSMANMIQRARMEREALALQKQRVAQDQQRITLDQQFRDRQAQEQDLEAQSKLNQFGRRTVGGAVEDSMPAPETPLKGMGPERLPIMRPADPARTVKYKTRDGQQLEYELKTPEEQAQFALEQHRKQAEATADVQSQARIREQRDKFEREAVPVAKWIQDELGMAHNPDLKVEPSAYDNMVRGALAAEAKRNQAKSIVHSFAITGTKGAAIVNVHADGSVDEVPTQTTGPRTAPQGETPNQARLRERDATKDAVERAASLASFGAKSYEDAVAKLDKTIAANNTPTLKEHRNAIVQQLRKQYGVSASKPQESIDDLLGGADTGKDSKPDTGKDKPKPAKGKVTGEQIRKYAKRKQIDYKTASKEFTDAGYEIGQ